MSPSLEGRAIAGARIEENVIEVLARHPGTTAPSPTR
jgi:hypothetical protein